jgi:hypothetical protein
VKQPIAGITGLKPARAEIGRRRQTFQARIACAGPEYRIQRNQSLQLKNRREQIQATRGRGELVEIRLVQLQASFLLLTMRRRALALPQMLSDRLAGVGDPLEIKAILDEAMRSLLSELQELPNRIDPAEWAKFLAEEEGNGAAEPPRRKQK